MRNPSKSILLIVTLAVGACGPNPSSSGPAPFDAPDVAVHPLREAYFGDLHLHTSLSIDAFITNTRTMPDDAYRYAQGEPIDHVSGQKVQIQTPLDFLAVTDHAELIGVARGMADPDNPLSQSPLAASITSNDYQTSQGAFRSIVGAAASGQVDSVLSPQEAASTMTDSWQLIVDAAEAHNQPGKFTTFIAYEWSSMPEFANLHRNVVFRGATAPMLPFSSTNSNRPEDLWAFLDRWREEEGEDVIAIPHNSNASMGRMYPLVDSSGQPIDADYAMQRTRNEPLTEITQAKGTSETHPALSPVDEDANFELWETVVGGTIPVSPEIGSYVRSAYRRGLELEEQIGVNPYRFGIVGASDNHDSTSAVEESNFTGGHGNADATADIRLHSKPSTLVASSLNFSASGLTGAWAESNTRDAIFDALRRKETFGTSGTRIRVRFFAGNYPADLAQNPDALEIAYGDGTAMGGDFVAEDEPPRFFVQATRDPASAPLDRIQIVKGWLDEAGSHEQVYDVVCSDGRSPDPSNHRCPDSGASVDLDTCAFSQDQGAGELAAVWSDPSFSDSQRAFYYVRVLENPTCRWSTWDAIRLGVDPPAEKPATLQERAWSSPIWISPSSAP